MKHSRGSSQSSIVGAGQAATPAVTAMANTSTTPMGPRSASAIHTYSSSATAQSGTPMRPSKTMHQTAAPQESRPRVNWPATSQAVVQLLEFINEVTEETQEAEEVEQNDLIDWVEENADESLKHHNGWSQIINQRCILQM